MWCSQRVHIFIVIARSNYKGQGFWLMWESKVALSSVSVKKLLNAGVVLSAVDTGVFKTGPAWFPLQSV